MDIDEFEGFWAQPPPVKAMVRKLVRTANITPGAGAHIPSVPNAGTPSSGAGAGPQPQRVNGAPLNQFHQ